jgi:hypothetical protein
MAGSAWMMAKFEVRALPAAGTASARARAAGQHQVGDAGDTAEPGDADRAAAAGEDAPAPPRQREERRGVGHPDGGGSGGFEPAVGHPGPPPAVMRAVCSDTLAA